MKNHTSAILYDTPCLTDDLKPKKSMSIYSLISVTNVRMSDTGCVNHRLVTGKWNKYQLLSPANCTVLSFREPCYNDYNNDEKLAIYEARCYNKKDLAKCCSLDLQKEINVIDNFGCRYWTNFKNEIEEVWHWKSKCRT